MRAPGELLKPEDLAVDALLSAWRLLGCELVRDGVRVRITEVEAYRGPDDTAAHTRSGPTARNAPMWGPAGRAYVYLCYGIHHLLNVVTGDEGEGTAVLIRAVEPVAGHDVLAQRRGGRTGPDALAGPGKVGQALGLDTSWSHHPLCEPGGLELRVGPAPAEVLAGPRVGVDYAEPVHRDAPWRLADGTTRAVSHRRTLGPAGPPPPGATRYRGPGSARSS